MLPVYNHTGDGFSGLHYDPLLPGTISHIRPTRHLPLSEGQEVLQIQSTAVALAAPRAMNLMVVKRIVHCCALQLEKAAAKQPTRPNRVAKPPWHNQRLAGWRALAIQTKVTTRWTTSAS